MLPLLPSPTPTSFLTSSSCSPALSPPIPAGGRAARRGWVAGWEGRPGEGRAPARVCPAVVGVCLLCAGLRVAVARSGPLLSLGGRGQPFAVLNFFGLDAAPLRVRCDGRWWGARLRFLTSSGDEGRGQGVGVRLNRTPGPESWDRGRQGIRAGRAAGEKRGRGTRALGWRPGTQGTEPRRPGAPHLALHAQPSRAPRRTPPLALEAGGDPRARAPRPIGREEESKPRGEAARILRPGAPAREPPGT